MRTLIFNGSPRVRGDTAFLLSLLKEQLKGEIRTVDAYRCGIAPCIDCRYCMKNDGCSIKDGMQEIYGYIRDCDGIVIASPVYFSELTGKLLDVGSRLQSFYCARTFRNIEPVQKSKKGAVILTGGGDGSPDKAFSTARILLGQMGCRDIHPLVKSCRTNERPASKDEEAKAGIMSIARFLSE